MEKLKGNLKESSVRSSVRVNSRSAKMPRLWPRTGSSRRSACGEEGGSRLEKLKGNPKESSVRSSVRVNSRSAKIPQIGRAHV